MAPVRNDRLEEMDEMKDVALIPEDAREQLVFKALPRLAALPINESIWAVSCPRTPV